MQKKSKNLSKTEEKLNFQALRDGVLQAIGMKSCNFPPSSSKCNLKMPYHKSDL